MKIWTQFILLLTMQINCTVDLYQRDLFEIYRQIQDNHPGMYNHLDPNFAIQLHTSYQKALQAILSKVLQ